MTRIQTAMILGAGLGLRMRPVSLETPKPLIKLGGRAILDRLLDKLAAAGITRVIVNVHWLADKMRAHLANRSDLEIIISDETDGLLDSGGGIIKALPHLGADPFIVLNGDSVWIDTLHPSLTRLIENFDASRMDCLMLLAATLRSLGYDGPGDFLMESDGQLSRRPESMLTPFVYCGAFIASHALFRDAPDGAFSLNRLWDRAIEDGRLFGLRHDGPWLHAGTPGALEEIEAFLADL